VLVRQKSLFEPCSNRTEKAKSKIRRRNSTMAIESIELSRTGLPEGITAGYSEEFGGSFAIYQEGELVALGRVGAEKDTFRAAFNGSGRPYYEVWKQNQTVKKEITE